MSRHHIFMAPAAVTAVWYVGETHQTACPSTQRRRDGAWNRCEARPAKRYTHPHTGAGTATGTGVRRDPPKDTLQHYLQAEFASAAIPGAKLLRFDRGGHLLFAVEQDAVRSAVQKHIQEN